MYQSNWMPDSSCAKTSVSSQWQQLISGRVYLLRRSRNWVYNQIESLIKSVIDISLPQVFPDTGLRQRNLTCLDQEGHRWNEDLPDCVGNKTLLLCSHFVLRAPICANAQSNEQSFFVFFFFFLQMWNRSKPVATRHSSTFSAEPVWILLTLNLANWAITTSPTVRYKNCFNHQQKIN